MKILLAYHCVFGVREKTEVPRMKLTQAHGEHEQLDANSILTGISRITETVNGMFPIYPQYTVKCKEMKELEQDLSSRQADYIPFNRSTWYQVSRRQ